MTSDIWIEKYRPSRLCDIEGNEQTLQRLRAIARDGNMPHFMMAGPPGTGKTTSILCLSRELLGQNAQRAVIELNASDDRGIDVVRDRIKSFAKEKVDLPHGRHKIVILDEVDAMTEAAQQALRRLMEVHADTTRFALACNQSTKIIEPIQSRCAIIRYLKLKDEHVLRRLIHICKEENVDYVDSGMDALVFTAEGDMRNAINNLQSTVSGFGTVNRENVLKVCDVPPPEKIRDILLLCKEVRWKEAHDTAEELVVSLGYEPIDIVGLMRSVLKRIDLPEHVVLEFIKEVARCHYVMAEGCDTILQLDRLLCNLCRVCARA